MQGVERDRQLAGNQQNVQPIYQTNTIRRIAKLAYRTLVFTVFFSLGFVTGFTFTGALIPVLHAQNVVILSKLFCFCGYIQAMHWSVTFLSQIEVTVLRGY